MDWPSAQSLLSKKNCRQCQRGMRFGTSKGDFSLACMEARLDKTHQQGTTCTATPLWHGHLQRTVATGLSDFFRRHLTENKKLAGKSLRIKNLT